MKKHKKKHPLEISVFKEATSLNISRTLVALSGGADSIATTFSLKQAGIVIFALHCNFHLRGEESNRDMKFVKCFCEKHDIPLEVRDFNVEDYIAQNKGVSIEMACRNLRHDWFREKLKESGYQRIATGHNADDNIETFFLNLLRGSGTRGLKGMISDNGIIWRPLLRFHRKDILDYLQENDLDYIVDSTNLKNDYRRNYLRNKIIPLMKEEWKGFDSAMDKSISNISQENRIVEDYLQTTLPVRNQKFPVSEILSSPSPVLLIKRFVDPYGAYSTTPYEILEAIKAAKPHIRRWRLKLGWVFLRNGSLFVEMGHGESSA